MLAVAHSVSAAVAIVVISLFVNGSQRWFYGVVKYNFVGRKFVL